MEHQLLPTEHIAAALEEYAIAVRNEYQDNLILNDRIASGALLNSVEYLIDNNGIEYEVKLELNHYWRYIEEGTEPHKPPIGAILKWIQVKPVIPRPRNGITPTQTQLAYMIQAAIAKNGTEGSHDLTDALTKINAEFRERLTAALIEDTAHLQSLLFQDIANR